MTITSRPDTVYTDLDDLKRRLRTLEAKLGGGIVAPLPVTSSTGGGTAPASGGSGGAAPSSTVVAAQAFGLALARGSQTSGLYAPGDHSHGTPAAENPMTTLDDLIIGGAAGAMTRLGKGADGQVLTVDPTTHHLLWATPAAGGGSGGGTVGLNDFSLTNTVLATNNAGAVLLLHDRVLASEPAGTYLLIAYLYQQNAAAGAISIRAASGGAAVAVVNSIATHNFAGFKTFAAVFTHTGGQLEVQITGNDESGGAITFGLGPDNRFARQLTIAQVTTTASSANETTASTLINATSAGDAGNRADHFAGSALGAAWTFEGSPVGQGPVVANSSLGYSSSAAPGSYYTRPYTPTGAFSVQARLLRNNNGNAGSSGGLIIRDSTAGGDVGSGILVDLNNSGTVLFSMVAGAFTARATLPLVATQSVYYYIRIDRDGANNWTGYISQDRALWIPLGASYAMTFVVAKVGLRVGSLNIAAYDFFDVAS